ncbi:ABC transporter ATP-binding protein [Candidatus Woesebacteria bacterium]|nr:ABC transporter ATP-binding protein [Candidatus Woesebacteria bacterium]
MKTVIEVKNIGKRYTIFHQRGSYIALRDSIAYAFTHPLSLFRRKQREAFWPLRSVNFAIKQGEVVGIIGQNGAGKSTLLKILSQITPPTEGEIKITGRVGSLLEVGTGFHPELTGRENIFLNGAILGMKRREITTKFNDIVEFAGIEKFLDTPVKYYSSGMYVRLAFSVAAHMETDILIIDEVLAVGDAAFQKKCLGKMQELTSRNGKTILFVSHDMAAIKRLCSRAILIDQGSIKMSGPTDEVVAAYLVDSKQKLSMPITERTDRGGSGKVRFTKCEKGDTENQGKKITLTIGYTNTTGHAIENVKISADIRDENNTCVANLTNSTLEQTISLNNGEGIITLEILSPNIASGKYVLDLFLASDQLNSEIFDWVQGAMVLEIDNDSFYPTKKLPPVKSLALLNYVFKNN